MTSCMLYLPPNIILHLQHQYMSLTHRMKILSSELSSMQDGSFRRIFFTKESVLPPPIMLPNVDNYAASSPYICHELTVEVFCLGIEILQNESKQKQLSKSAPMITISEKSFHLIREIQWYLQICCSRCTYCDNNNSFDLKYNSNYIQDYSDIDKYDMSIAPAANLKVQPSLQSFKGSFSQSRQPKIEAQQARCVLGSNCVKNEIISTMVHDAASILTRKLRQMACSTNLVLQRLNMILQGLYAECWLRYLHPNAKISEIRQKS